jgi:hypothetical protein
MGALPAGARYASSDQLLQRQAQQAQAQLPAKRAAEPGHGQGVPQQSCVSSADEAELGSESPVGRHGVANAQGLANGVVGEPAAKVPRLS